MPDSMPPCNKRAEMRVQRSKHSSPNHNQAVKAWDLKHNIFFVWHQCFNLNYSIQMQGLIFWSVKNYQLNILHA
jgi:hypothetical protein